jgi:putative ABC transport system substrate-binding protein
LISSTFKIVLLAIIGVITISTNGINVPHIEAGDIRIAVLISYKGDPFDETVDGFQKYLSNHRISIDYELFQIGGDNEKVVQALQKLKTNRPSLIFTLGSLATEATLKEIRDIPVIVGMILRSDPLKKASNSTGVFLEFPVEIQFKWLQYILPDTKTIGVIYNPKENQERIENADKIAQKMGFTLKAKEVHVPQDLPYALNGLSKNVDVLWGVADNLVLIPQTAKYILLFSFRNSIPLIGLSSTWVKAGALYALETDYTDKGMQCGEMALRVLNGTKVSSIPPAPPRKVIYSLNLNTVEQMKIKISEKVVREAYRIY